MKFQDPCETEPFRTQWFMSAKGFVDVAHLVSIPHGERFRSEFVGASYAVTYQDFFPAYMDTQNSLLSYIGYIMQSRAQLKITCE